MVFRPRRYVNKVQCGFRYSIGRGNSYMTQYNYKIGTESEPLENFKVNIYLDYRVKYMGQPEKSPNDLFFRAQIMYDIL